jgi:hypothetical protein
VVGPKLLGKRWIMPNIRNDIEELIPGGYMIANAERGNDLSPSRLAHETPHHSS